MRLKQKTKSIFILLALTMIMYGCNRTEFSDLEKYINGIKNAKAKQQPKPVFAPPEAHPSTYQATNLRSPFGTQEEIAKTKTGAVSSTNPLQAYPLSMLRFVGIVTESQKTVAYVKTPDNLVYQVQVGDAIGDGDGRISAIYPDRINIIETEMQKDNSQIQRVITLQLKDQH